MNDIIISEASIYVGTYRKYNEGSLEGKWMNLKDYADKEEFYKACRKLHKDEADPEFMFQDWEHIPDSLIGESWLSDDFFEFRDALVELYDAEQSAFLTWFDHERCDINRYMSDIMDKFRDSYQGQYESEGDYAEHIVDECYDLPDFAKRYFDYEKFARDLFISDYWFEDGFVFRHC